MSDIISIVLAAGQGTRMKSKTLKCLHKIAGLPMIDHVLMTLKQVNSTKTVLVVSEEMKKEIVFAEDLGVVVQKERLGTAHAALCAKEYFKDIDGDVIVIFGDNPLIRAETIDNMLKKRREGLAVVVLGFEAKDPMRYGRLVLAPDGLLEKIVEFKDASTTEKKIKLCNSGVMCFDGRYISELLSGIDNNNNAKEYYLTDAVIKAKAKNLKVGVVIGDESEMLGVNSRSDLAAAERAYQKRKRKEFLDKGVTMTNPKTVYFHYDTEIGNDVTIEPNVFFGANVKIEDDVTVKAYSYIEGATVKAGAVIGPFARLRPGAVIEKEAHIGNFVEIKNSTVGEKSKVNHLSYIGDTVLGIKTNIGAGTITCNYDGYFKHKSFIGDNVFIGSHTCIVSPVKIGSDAFTAAGSVITNDVPENSMAIARSRQQTKEGWAEAYHENKRTAKAQQKK